TVLFDIAGDERKQKVLTNTPVTPFGITCIYPQIPGIPPYHNNGIWPFVQAFWTLANASDKNMDAVEAGLASIIRPTALFLTNKENFVAETGDFAGTEVNSDRQLWSVAAMLAMYHRVLTGISFSKAGMEFNPVIPKSFSGNYSLHNFRYRDGTYNITVSGWGDSISSFSIDGVRSAGNLIPTEMTGNHTVEIFMNKKANNIGFNQAINYTAPETPVLKVENNRLFWNGVTGAKSYQLFRNGKLLEVSNDTTISPAEEASEYQVMAEDSNGVCSFLSNPVKVGSGANATEAEIFNIRRETIVPGFSGTGYIRSGIKENSELIIRIHAEAGNYLIRARYANGTGPVNTDNNCAIRSLYVNGRYTCPLVFPQRGKDEWSDWGYTFPERIELKDGENILAIRYEDFNRNMDGEINEFLLDLISLEKIN
ncbi:MAG: glycogen debranching protein, partial [Bacteroidales bacterium]|nr:glycogen debranching protein [Bacteroidales bacterium]